jgi:hypothetical protein
MNFGIALRTCATTKQILFRFARSTLHMQVVFGTDPFLFGNTLGMGFSTEITDDQMHLYLSG